MNRLRTNVYVDGFNLFFGALKGRGAGYKWLDVGLLCRRLLPGNQVERIRYFTARVSARPDDPRMPERQHAYLRALQTIPQLTIHEGNFKITHPWMPLCDPAAAPRQPLRKVQVIKTEEKGSDVNLASYMILDACRQDCDVLVVITNDSDLQEPIRLVEEEMGLPVGVVNPHPTSKRSRAIKGTFFRQLRTNVVRQCQFPDVVKDAESRPVHKPVDW